MQWEDLEVWKESYELVLRVYDVMKTFPKNETYALTDQIKRASSSGLEKQHARRLLHNPYSIIQYFQQLRSTPRELQRMS